MNALISLLAAPSQEDVFKSISENVGGSDFDGTNILYVIGGLIALIILIAVAGRQRQGNPVAPKAKNHQGKLLKEVLRSIPLKTKELKQLKTIADHADAGKPIASPLTLILCPSLLAQTVQTKRLKLDRRSLASVARKAGLQVTRK